MLSGLFAFLSGSVFRMVWGEVASYIQKKQDHAHELEMMRLQSDLEGARHDRDMARIKLQSDLSVKEITVAGDLAIQKSDADAFLEAVKNATKPIGIAWVDAWNGIIRPLTASAALALWSWAFVSNGFVLSDWDRDLMGVAIGFFFADRSLGKRGK